MALNANHTFEELEGIRCSIAEKKCSLARARFLEQLLVFNNYEVKVVKEAVPAAKAAVPVPAEEAAAATPVPAETFTVAVTDVTFNPVKAIFNRELKAPEGYFVDRRYWKQEPPVEGEYNWYWGPVQTDT